MKTLTAEEFVKEFGAHPSKLFNINLFIERKHRLEALRTRSSRRAVTRRFYATNKMEGHPDLLYGIDIAYWMKKDDFHAEIRKVVMFDTKEEMKADQAVRTID